MNWFKKTKYILFNSEYRSRHILLLVSLVSYIIYFTILSYLYSESGSTMTVVAFAISTVFAFMALTISIASFSAKSLWIFLPHFKIELPRNQFEELWQNIQDENVVALIDWSDPFYARYFILCRSKDMMMCLKLRYL